MNLHREEQETTINYDASSQMASIFTHHNPTIRRLAKLSGEFPETYRLIKIDQWGGYHYEMPYRLIRFKRPASEAQRAASRQNIAGNAAFPKENSLAQGRKNESDSQDEEQAG